MRRSSDIEAQQTELDRSIDDIAQAHVEMGQDWRLWVWRRRCGFDFARLKRCGEAA